MKRKVLYMMAIVTSIGLMSGCQASPPYSMQTPASGTPEGQPEATPSASGKSERETTQKGKKYVYVPDTFAVYADGEPHRLMYAADEKYYYYGTFTGTPLSDYGYKNISLPSSLQEISYTVPAGETLEDANIAEMAGTSVINASVCFSQTRNIYSIRTPGLYLFHAWKQKYDGEIHTLTLKDFAGILNIGGSLTSDFEDMELLEDGSTRYTCRYKDEREYTGDGIPYYGKAVIRLKDGMAWCAVFGEKDHEDGPRMAEYVLKQSVIYEEENGHE